MSPTGEALALGLTLAVHLIGAFALIAVLLRGSDGGVRDWWPDDEDGGSPRGDADPPRPGPGGGGLPLPDADPSPVRLRGPGRLADAHPRPARRPAHPPAAPERLPERVPRNAGS